MGISLNMLRRLKQLMPARLKRAVNEIRLKWKLRRAVRRIARLPLGHIPTVEMLIELQTGWSNEGYAARTDFLKEVAKRALMTAGPILECGSGLTTILVGLLAGRRGVKTYSLEHISDDADDLWLPNYLEGQLKFLREHNCDLVCADAIIFGDSPDAGRTYMTAVMETAPPAGAVSFFDLVSAKRSLITSGVIARRELIFEIGLFDEALRNAQDFDLWLRLARHGARLAYHRQVLLRYRSRMNSLTGDATNSLNRELRVLDKIERSYNLTPAEIREVAPVIRGRKAILQFELGKLLLAQGDLESARAAFASASNSRRSWKTMAELWFSRLTPGLMQALYLRRMQNASVK